MYIDTDYIYVYAVLWGVLYVNLSYIIKKNAYSEDLHACTYNSYIRKSLEAQMMPTINLEKYLYRVFLIENTTMHIDERSVKIKKNPSKRGPFVISQEKDNLNFWDFRD